MESPLTELPLIGIFSNNWLLVLALLLLLITLRTVLTILSKRQKFPYELKSNYLTPAELSFLTVLKSAVNGRYEIIPQVALKSIIKVKNSVKDFYIYFNKIDRKVLDFVLFERINYKPLLIIELDDSSHNQFDRKERDYFVDKVVSTAKIPILHIPVKYTYSPDTLAKQIMETIKP